MSRFASSARVAAAVWLALWLAAGGCKFNEITLATTEQQIVVHAVLNPAVATQVVLVETTLTGAVQVQDSAFDPADPIASDGGVPVSSAVVTLTDSAGRSAIGVEDRVDDGSRGTGVYRVALATPPVAGGRYSLRVETPQGKIVTGETRVPRPTAVASGSLTRVFNRDHDTLDLQWPAAAMSRIYAVRVESPFGPYFLFTDSTRLRLVGDARNLFASNLEHLFIPGFRQDVIVAAVDSNFYDYYRTNNDPFTGAGLINRLSGGIGLFGALAPVTGGTLTVTADQTEPIEGRFRASPPTRDPLRIASLNIYIESKSTRADLPDVLSGRATSANSAATSNGMVGELSGSHVTLVLVSTQLAHDTLDVFTGDLSIDGTTLTGVFRSGGPVHYTYVKQ